MGFDVLSAATTTGNQLANSDILNSMVSKLIHDQAESSFCWAFAISSMLRQSLKMFFHQAWDHGTVHNRSFDLYYNQSPYPVTVDANKNAAIAHKLNANQFHKQLRNELIMLPIPKAKFFHAKVPNGVDPEDFEDEIIGKQAHVLENAINRVSQNYWSHK